MDAQEGSFQDLFGESGLGNGVFWFDAEFNGDLLGGLADMPMEPLLGLGEAPYIPLPPEPACPSFTAVGPASSRPTSGGLPSGPSAPGAGPSSMSKAEMQRQKNKEVQARYRQKQKAKQQQLLADHAAAAAELAQLRAENEKLAKLNTTLERVLVIRDTAVNVLEQAKSSLSEAGAALSGGSSSRLPSGVTFQEGSFSTAASAESPQTSGGGAASGGGGGGGRSQLTGTASGSSSLQEAELPQGPHGVYGAYPSPSVFLSVVGDPSVIDQVKGYTAEQFIEAWRRGVRQLKELLSEYDATASKATMERMQDDLQRRAAIMSLALKFRPENVQALFATAEADPLETRDARSAAILAACQLTRSQHEAIAAVWRTYSTKLSALREERLAALQALQSSQQVPPDFLERSSLNAIVAQYVSVADAASSLNDYSHRETAAMLHCMAALGHCLMPLQKARTLCMSCPTFPDLLGLMRIMVGADAALLEAG